MVDRGLQWQSITEMMEYYLDHRLCQVVIGRESTQRASSVNSVISRHEVSSILRTLLRSSRVRILQNVMLRIPAFVLLS